MSEIVAQRMNEFGEFVRKQFATDGEFQASMIIHTKRDGTIVIPANAFMRDRSSQTTLSFGVQFLSCMLGRIEIDYIIFASEFYHLPVNASDAQEAADRRRELVKTYGSLANVPGVKEALAVAYEDDNAALMQSWRIEKNDAGKNVVDVTSFQQTEFYKPEGRSLDNLLSCPLYHSHFLEKQIVSVVQSAPAAICNDRPEDIYELIARGISKALGDDAPMKGLGVALSLFKTIRTGAPALPGIEMHRRNDAHSATKH